MSTGDGAVIVAGSLSMSRLAPDPPGSRQIATGGKLGLLRNADDSLEDLLGLIAGTDAINDRAGTRTSGSGTT